MIGFARGFALLGHHQRTHARTHKRIEALDGCCLRAGPPQTVGDNRSSSRVPPLWNQVVRSEQLRVSQQRCLPGVCGSQTMQANTYEMPMAEDPVRIDQICDMNTVLPRTRIADDAGDSRKFAFAGSDTSERSGSSEHDGAKPAHRKTSSLFPRCSTTGRHNTL